MFWLVLEIILTITLGVCGGILIYGGVCTGSPIALFIGIILTIFCILVPKLDKDN